MIRAWFVNDYKCFIKSQVLQLDSSFSFRVISYEEGKALAESWNAAFLESSAKENQVRVLEKVPALRPSAPGVGPRQPCRSCLPCVLPFPSPAWLAVFHL